MPLQDMLASADRWVRGKWFMFGKQHDAPRTSAAFRLDPEPQVRVMIHYALMQRGGALQPATSLS